MSVKQLVTAEELWDMPDDSGKRLELVDGEVVEVPGAGELHIAIVFALARLLEDFVRQHDLGLVMPDGLAYVLRRGPDQVRIPDVSFVEWERVPEEGVPRGVLGRTAHPGRRGRHARRLGGRFTCASSGLPRSRIGPGVGPVAATKLSVGLSTGCRHRELGPDAILDGGDILPGFTSRVSDLFDVRRRR